jgi:hypothetical protein
MRLIIPAISILALTTTLAGAQSSFDAAGTSCGQFLKARANDALHRQVSNWLYGYASGLTAGLRAAQDPAGLNLTNDQLVRSATDYCQANPGATIANAASAWVPQQPPPKAEGPPSGRGFFLDLSKPATNPGGRR